MVEQQVPLIVYMRLAYYVAKNGSDGNPGAETQPWLTISRVQKEGICVKGASKNGLIYGNLVDNAAVGIYVGGRDSHTKIYGNVIPNCVNGIAVSIENMGDLFSSYFDIYNNIISNTYNGTALDLGFSNPVEHINISNNTVYDFYRGIHLTSSQYSVITINNNILYAIRDNSYYQYG